MNSAMPVTAGGVTVGVILLGWRLIQWWPGKKKLLSDPLGSVTGLIPYAFGWIYGTLGTLTVAGLVGWVFDTVVWVSNWLGDAAIILGVGGSAGRSSQGSYLPLTTEGTYIVLILTFLTIALIKFRRCGREVKLGAWTGATLGTSAGIAGVTAVPLAQAANWLGDAVFGAL